MLVHQNGNGLVFLVFSFRSVAAWIYGDVHQLYSIKILVSLARAPFSFFWLSRFLFQGDLPLMAAAFGMSLAGLRGLSEGNSFEFHAFLALMSLFTYLTS